MSLEATLPLSVVNVPNDYFYMAGFEVTLRGRFWVTAEVLRNRNIVVTRKEGANVYYSVSDKSIFKLFDAAKEIFNHHLVGVHSMLEEIHAVAPTKSARRSTSQRVR